MVLSRIRQPLVSRPLSAFGARLLSSSSPSRSVSRCYVPKVLSMDENGSLLRCTSISMVTRFHDDFSKIKLQFGLRYVSSAEDPSHTVLEMPALSPTMSQGNIAKWRKKEGDKIAVGDVLCEIETDKATVEFESLEEGYLAKILVLEGSKDILVGQPIAVTVEDPDDIESVPAIGGGSELKEEKSAPQDVAFQDTLETSTVKIDTSELPAHMVLEMPALSPTMNQGNITKWRKKEGDKIGVGDVICELETDKATLEYESLEEGYLAKILAPDGSKDVTVGQPIAVTVESSEDIEIVKASYSLSLIEKEEKPAAQPKKREVKEQKSSISRISPSAKLLISEFGLDTSLLSPSGPRGTLLKGDVLAAIKSGMGSPTASVPKEKQSLSPQIQSHSKPSATPQSDSYEDLPNSQIRKVIARRLLESKQNSPHLYLTTDVILDPLLSFRKELMEKHNIKVSVNDIVIKAVAVALHNVPVANGFWDAKKQEVIFNDSVDISIAVATEKGLMTPIVRNADQKTISVISSEVKELAEKARAGRLKPEEFQGGTFSISNLGMFPVDHFCAIINPPQAGILAVGRGNKVVEPVIETDDTEKLAVVTKMNLTLSADHRVFDGKVGGEFLRALRANFSDIRRLLL